MYLSVYCGECVLSVNAGNVFECVCWRMCSESKCCASVFLRDHAGSVLSVHTGKCVLSECCINVFEYEVF